MKRQELIRHVEANGCRLLREGVKHSVYFNPVNNQTTAVPRHRELNDFLARKICRDLGRISANYNARAIRRTRDIVVAIGRSLAEHAIEPKPNLR